MFAVPQKWKVTRMDRAALLPITADEAKALAAHLDPIVSIQPEYLIGQTPHFIAYQINIAWTKEGARLADFLKAMGHAA